MYPNWYNPHKGPAFKTVIERVSEIYKVPAEEIRGTCRKRHIVEARWVCAYVLRKRNGLSYPAIGRLLNRDHTSIMHACESLPHLKKYRPTIQEALDRILR